MTTQDYYIILTTLGEAKVAAAIAEQTSISLTEMAVGDADYTPSKGQASLVNEQWRDSLNSLERDTENPNYIIAEAVIPTEDGGWEVREVGIFDGDGDLFAIGKFPVTYKPTLPEGSGKDLYIRFIMEVSSEAEVTLLIDPAVVLATRNYVDDEIDDHNEDPNAHNSWAGVIAYTAEETIPGGWSEYTAARGRMIVGLPENGTLEGTLSTPLSDLEDRTHYHAGTSHTHSSNATGGMSGDAGTKAHDIRAGGLGDGEAIYADSGPNFGSHYYIEAGVQSGGTGSTGTAALSEILAYIQLMAIIKD